MNRHVNHTKRFGMTELEIHLKWAKLSGSCSAIMHLLCSKVGKHNSVVVSRQLLADELGMSTRTVQRAITKLKSNNWVRETRLGAGGGVNVYTINSEVIWTEGRDKLRYAEFSATVFVSEKEQPEGSLDASKETLQTVPDYYLQSAGFSQESVEMSDEEG